MEAIFKIKLFPKIDNYLHKNYVKLNFLDSFDVPDLELEYLFDTSNSSLNNKESDKLLILLAFFQIKINISI